MHLALSHDRRALSLERPRPLGTVAIRLSWLALGMAVAMSLMSRVHPTVSFSAPQLTPPVHAKTLAAAPALVAPPVIPGSMAFDG